MFQMYYIIFECFYHMLLFFICIIYCYRIKLYNTDNYLVLNGKDLELHTVNSHADATDFKFKWNKALGLFDILKPRQDKNLSIYFNIDVNRYEVGKENISQKIIPVTIEIYKRTYWLMNNDKCMTFIPSLNIFENHNCNIENPNQHFILECLQNNEEMKILDDDSDKDNIHLTFNDRDYQVNAKDFFYKDENEIFTQAKMERHGKFLITNMHKLIYDLSACMIEKSVCAVDGWKLFESVASYFYNSQKKSSYSASKTSTSSASKKSLGSKKSTSSASKTSIS